MKIIEDMVQIMGCQSYQVIKMIADNFGCSDKALPLEEDDDILILIIVVIYFALKPKLL